MSSRTHRPGAMAGGPLYAAVRGQRRHRLYTNPSAPAFALPSAANCNCLSSSLVAAIESAWFVPRSGYARPRNNGFKFGALTARTVENRFTGGSPSLSSTTMTDSIPEYTAAAGPEGLGSKRRRLLSPLGTGGNRQPAGLHYLYQWVRRPHRGEHAQRECPADRHAHQRIQQQLRVQRRGIRQRSQVAGGSRNAREAHLRAGLLGRSPSRFRPS